MLILILFVFFSFFCYFYCHFCQSLINLWWPNGYGDQQLYLLKVNVNIDNESSSLTTKFGFRTVELVQEPVDPYSSKKGLLMHLIFFIFSVFLFISKYSFSNSILLILCCPIFVITWF